MEAYSLTPQAPEAKLFEDEDFKKICVASLIAGAPAVVGLGLYARDKSIIKWWNGLSKPHWAEVNEKIYMAVAP